MTCFAQVFAQNMSTMEMLINKDWYEVDIMNMKTHENYYMRFTGTQRMLVGQDSLGNTKARVQNYYISNRYEEHFDSTKIGKRKNGRFLIIQGQNNHINNNVICLEIDRLKDGELQLTDQNHLSKLKKYYFSELDEDKRGDVISTRDLLVNKTWYQVNPETGKRMNLEHTYNDKHFMRCILPENKKTQIPQWMLREYYFSDTIVTKFNRKQVGKRNNGVYLVVNELADDGEWQAATYDMTTLSENRLVLECVYPKGYATQVFESSLYSKNAEHSKKKPQITDLMKSEWYKLDTADWSRSGYIEQYNSTHVTRIAPIKSKGDTIKLKTMYEYYMSNQPESEFDWSQKGRRSEGDYLVVHERERNGKWHVVNYRIALLDGNNLVLINETSPDSLISLYERNAEQHAGIALGDTVCNQETGFRTITVKERLMGKQWRKLDRSGKYKALYCYYFNQNKLASPFTHKTKGGYMTEAATLDYYLSNTPHFTFQFGELDKNDNGKYINRYVASNDVCNSYCWGIRYISDKLLILWSVPFPVEDFVMTPEFMKDIILLSE